MKILESQVTKMEITDLVKDFSIDNAIVIVEDFSNGDGRIIIACLGQAWTSYFYAMDGKPTSEFFCSCSDARLIDALCFLPQERINPPSYLYRIIAAVKKALNDTRNLNEKFEEIATDNV